MSQFRRRHFQIAAAGLAALSMPALAQQEKRVRRIGYFGGASLQRNAAYLAAFREGMADQVGTGTKHPVTMNEGIRECSGPAADSDVQSRA